MTTPHQTLVQHFQAHYPGSQATERLVQHPELINDILPDSHRRIIDFALYKEDYDAVLLLVDAGVDPNIDVSIPGHYHTRSLLSAVVRGGRIDVIRRLVDLGADPNHNARGAIPPLVEACALEQPRDVIEALLALGLRLYAERGEDGPGRGPALRVRLEPHSRGAI